MTHARRRGGRGAIAMLLLAPLVVRCGLDEPAREELYCENAAARLERCCPGFRAAAQYCTYSKTGCDYPPLEETETRPALSEGDAVCVADASCAALVDGGACARAAAATRRVTPEPSHVCR